MYFAKINLNLTTYNLLVFLKFISNCLIQKQKKTVRLFKSNYYLQTSTVKIREKKWFITKTKKKRRKQTIKSFYANVYKTNFS